LSDAPLRAPMRAVDVVPGAGFSGEVRPDPAGERPSLLCEMATAFDGRGMGMVWSRTSAP
jgi:hypothetical protein